MDQSQKYQGSFMRILLYCLMFNPITHLFAMDGIGEASEALFIAAENNDAEKIKELLEQKKMNINARNDRGKTAVCIAASRGKNEALQELLRHNPDVNLPDNDCWTPLKKAADYGHLESAKLLLAAGANPNLADKEGYTPLMHASRAKMSFAMMQLLLTAGADTNHSACDGTTALYHAVADSRLVLVQLLVERGATDSSRCIKNGWNARDLANTYKGSVDYYGLKSEGHKCADFLNKGFGE